MVKKENKTIKMFISREEEIMEKLVKEDHAFRKLNKQDLRTLTTK